MTKTVKIVLSRLIAVIAGISLMTAYGCKPEGSTVVLEDYPVPVEEVKEDEEVPEPNDKEPFSETMVDKDIMPQPDTLRENGKYYFDPEIIPDFLLNYYANDPKIIRIAKRLLTAAYNAETEITFDDEENVDRNDVYKAYNVAVLSSPIFDAVNFYQIEDNTWGLTYFAPIVVDGMDEYGHNTYGQGESLEQQETKNMIDSYVGYVSGIINNNLTQESTDRERAEIIYKELIKDIKYNLDASDNPYGGGYQEAEGIGSVVFETGQAVKSVLNKEFFNNYRYLRLYSFILTQLHINVYEISGRGIFQNDWDTYLVKDENSILDQAGSMTYGNVATWNWSIVEIDGQNYICDLMLDKLVYDRLLEENGTVTDWEPVFFGMSDEKRNESFKTKNSDQVCIFAVSDTGSIAGTTFGSSINSTRPVPECPENLPLNE